MLREHAQYFMTDCWACEGAVQPVGDSQSAEAPFVKFNQPNDFCLLLPWPEM